eukprot:553236_1
MGQNRSGASIIDFTGDNNDHEMIKEHHNIATVRQDSYDNDLYIEDDEKYSNKEIEREIVTKTESQIFTLNMCTLRVTNEISMLLHRNFKDEYITCSNSNYLQRNNIRLGSWWYSAIKNLKYTGITMQNNIKVTIIYVDDGLLPKQKIENKIELISGLFYTKIDFNDELQITFNSNDFINYLNNNITTKNPYFADIKYNNKKYNHMIEYKTNINQTKSTKCFTN